MGKRRKARESKRAIAYMRASTDEQELSFDAQRGLIGEWAAREGVNVANWHVDPGVSGSAELADRPGLLAAMTELDTTTAGIFVIAKRDRLARDALIALTLEKAVNDCGARLVSADGVGNGSAPADEFMRHVMTGVAQLERAMIRERTKAALAAKRARGERIGGIPYGFGLASDGKHTMNGGERACIGRTCHGCVTLEPNPAEVYVMALARELYALPRMTLRKLARALADRGHLNRRGHLFDLRQLRAFIAAAEDAIVACAHGHTYETRWVGKYCVKGMCRNGERGDPNRRIEWRRGVSVVPEQVRQQAAEKRDAPDVVHLGVRRDEEEDQAHDGDDERQ
jgi:DNA invertase Pin-like site-specific DNA recombinase